MNHTAVVGPGNHIPYDLEETGLHLTNGNYLEKRDLKASYRQRQSLIN